MYKLLKVLVSGLLLGSMIIFCAPALAKSCYDKCETTYDSCTNKCKDWDDGCFDKCEDKAYKCTDKCDDQCTYNGLKSLNGKIRANKSRMH